MRDWSCTSSHNTPSKIEQREFYNGILMLSQKQMWITYPCIASSRREDNSSVLRRNALDVDETGTLWLYILSSCGLSKLKLRPTTYSWRSVWRVPIMTAVSFQDTHCPTELRHITLFPSFHICIKASQTHFLLAVSKSSLALIRMDGGKESPLGLPMLLLSLLTSCRCLNYFPLRRTSN